METLICGRWECKLVQFFWKPVLAASSKVYICILYDSVILFQKYLYLHIYVPKDMYKNVHNSITHNSPEPGAAQMPTTVDK